MKATKQPGRIRIDLDGPQGNAFALLGLYRQLGKDLGLMKSEIDQRIEEMMEGSYNDLIDILEEDFGDYIILEKSEW